MTKSFDEWVVDAESWSERDCYEAGQKSRQAEVDELQKRIDALSKKLNEMAHIFLDDLDDILKGNSHES